MKSLLSSLGLAVVVPLLGPVVLEQPKSLSSLISPTLVLEIMTPLMKALFPLVTLEDLPLSNETASGNSQGSTPPFSLEDLNPLTPPPLETTHPTSVSLITSTSFLNSRLFLSAQTFPNPQPASSSLLPFSAQPASDAVTLKLAKEITHASLNREA